MDNIVDCIYSIEVLLKKQKTSSGGNGFECWISAPRVNYLDKIGCGTIIFSTYLILECCNQIYE